MSNQQERVNVVRRQLSPQEIERFAVRDHDTMEDTVMALVREVAFLRRVLAAYVKGDQ